MIAQTRRFHGHNSLSYVYQRGKTVHSEQCALKYAPNTRRKSYRLAVVVSKKVSKSAVKRNRIRRRIYEIISLQEERITGAYDLVITVFNEDLAVMPAKDLEKLIIGQLKQAKIISS